MYRSTGKICRKKTPAKRGDLSQELLAGNCIGGTSAVVARRECFERVGLFDENLPSFQDYDLWIRISKVFGFEFVPDPLSNYYVHENKIWTDLSALSRGDRDLPKEARELDVSEKVFRLSILSSGS